MPPGFPPVTIDDCAYWDGGLFSNTPIDALLNLLHPEEIDSLPIFTIDLFATRNLPLPQNLLDVQTRTLALAAAGGDHDFSAYAVQAAYRAGRPAAAGRFAPSEVQQPKLRAVA